MTAPSPIAFPPTRKPCIISHVHPADSVQSYHATTADGGSYDATAWTPAIDASKAALQSPVPTGPKLTALHPKRYTTAPGKSAAKPTHLKANKTFMHRMIRCNQIQPRDNDSGSSSAIWLFYSNASRAMHRSPRIRSNFSPTRQS
jgi:hypothetical protein